MRVEEDPGVDEPVANTYEHVVLLVHSVTTTSKRNEPRPPAEIAANRVGSLRIESTQGASRMFLIDGGFAQVQQNTLTLLGSEIGRSAGSIQLLKENIQSHSEKSGLSP